MPLRITIELIPHGDERKKCKLAVVEIENDGTAESNGAGPIGNYLVRASGDCGPDVGWDDLPDVRVVGVPRLREGGRDYLGTSAACLSALANQKLSTAYNHPPTRDRCGRWLWAVVGLR